ncbi:unnamed protein product [Meganyctiphanes norvegica]|uniref:Uncharacterized protein n=1 Tax=Meganyctiphanes norvegica TaxID=48144 RepID=A0AAV2R843_MEGNR
MRTPKKNPNSREYEPVHIEPPTSVPLTDHNRDQPTANSAPSAAPLHPESASRDPLPIPDDNQNPQVSSFTSVINSQHKGSTFTFSSTSRPTSRAPSPGRNPDPFSDIPYPLSPNADTEPEYSRGPAQNPGVVPSAYAPSAPPSSTSQTGPSDPPPYSDPPPAYEDIYKPVIS